MIPTIALLPPTSQQTVEVQDGTHTEILGNELGCSVSVNVASFLTADVPPYGARKRCWGGGVVAFSDTCCPVLIT
jgi:hypothetical protein